MINNDSVVTAYDEHLTLVEWLQKVEVLLKNGGLKEVALNDKGNGSQYNKALFSLTLTFNDGTKIESNDMALKSVNEALNNLNGDINTNAHRIDDLEDQVDNKTIPLFGKYSILVPEDSAEANILPCTPSDDGKVLSVVNGEAQWASAGASGGKTLTISITDILTDNSKIQELISKMISATEQSALISFDNPINYDTYKDYDTIKLDLSPLSSMGVSGYYILRNQSHLNGYTPVYSLTTVGFVMGSSNLDKLVIKHLIIAGGDEVNTPLNKFLLRIL